MLLSTWWFTFYCLLLWNFYVFGTAPYISHSIHYGNGMALLHTKTETHHYGTATYLAPSHNIPIQAFCCLFGIAMGCKAPCSILFPYYPSLLLLIWDCYGLKSTIQFPYYPSILHVADMEILLHVSKHYISLPYHWDMVSDVGMIWNLLNFFNI